MYNNAKTADLLMIALAIVLGVGSIVLFAWDTRPTFVPMSWPAGVALAWDALLSLLFFIQHSGMVRRAFRARLTRVLPVRYDGAFYAITSGIALTLVVLLWQHVDTPVFRFQGVARWIAIACGLLGAALLVLSVYAGRRTIDLLGLRPIRAHLRGRSPQSTPFVVDGPYRWVRHPLYSCVLVLFWARPEMDADGFLLVTLWSAWMIVATFLEERDLVADFGDVYRRYRRRVPMFVPWRGPVDVQP